MFERKRYPIGAVAAAIATLASAAWAQSLQTIDASAAALSEPIVAESADRNRLRLTGNVNVAVRLSDPSLLQKLGANARTSPSLMSIDERRAYVDSLRAKQADVLAQIATLGGVELARLTRAGNLVVVSVPAMRVPEVARLPGVAAVLDVQDYTRHLEDSVPYVGGTAVHGQGYDGSGVTVAVLDSGIDYTHAQLGGPGTIAAFNAAAGNATLVEPGTFPTAKVIAGIDFVGETWPTGPLAPDPDPIGAGTDAGHGTHVADIVAGQLGMAPGASLMAVKVCSSVSTSCSGVAIVQGLEWIADPNGDLDFSDAPHVFNMSLGAAYGPRENPANELISALARFGMLPVISAGNNADRPYILGGPSNTVEAISVAQTSVPNAFGFPLVVNTPPAIAGVYTNTNTVPWAPITTGFTGNVRRAGAAGTPASLACDLADTIDFSGMVALIDRGICSVSIKVDNAANRGAIGVIIANNVAGDAPSFSFGGGTTFVQTLIVTQAIGNILKTVPTDTANVTVGGTAIPLAGSMVSTSSRGPAYNASAIKPEIGAPGAMLSAQYGTGTGRTIFGGTSGAAPMVAGAAALLLQQFPNSTPTEIKARLMNAAQRTIFTNPQTLPGELAPISRIGAGELRVDASSGLDAIAWDASNPAGVGLSFGTHRLGGPPTTFQRKVAVKNNTLSPQTFDIATDFRYANDQASGAVTFSHPPSVTVPAGSTAAFTLSMRVDPDLLPAWTASGLHLAANQGTGARLQAVEYDGYLRLAGGGDTLTLPWHVLPHQASNIAVSGNPVDLGGGPSGTFGLSNIGGSVASTTDVFALTGTSPRQSPFALPYGGGVALTDLKAAGVRPVDIGGGTLGLQFAIATWGERSHPAYPAELDILVDANDDGVDDFVVFTAEAGAFGSDGRTAVFVQSLGAATATAFFFIVADLNSSHAVLTVPGSAVGITSAAQRFRYSVLAFDNRVSGMLTDSIGSMTHTAGTPRFQLPGGANLLTVPIGAAGLVPVESVPGGAAASPSQTGLLLLHRDAKSNRESDLLVVNP